MQVPFQLLFARTFFGVRNFRSTVPSGVGSDAKITQRSVQSQSVIAEPIVESIGYRCEWIVLESGEVRERSDKVTLEQRPFDTNQTVYIPYSLYALLRSY
jgi:hypothetical protein